MMKKIVFILGLLANVAFSANVTEDLVVSLPNGQVQGTTFVTASNKTYYGFQGIPYGTPPVGELRLEAPQPAQPWSGILNGTVESKSCISTTWFYQAEFQSEDCLYVNVYIPTLEPEQNLPVMFWIYGGGFTEGSANKSFYGPDFLIEQDVIVVTFDYRVGPLGFLSTNDSVLPGNLGLKDQILALKWTNENIEFFGGDPENITIFGESAGGVAVGLILVSKQAAGLFRAAIVESGSALVTWAINTDPKAQAYLIADLIPGGTYGNDTQALKDFLKNRTIEEIMTANQVMTAPLQNWPTIEPESDDAFLTESPYVSLANGNFNQVPIVIGICAEETAFILWTLDAVEAAALAIDNNATLAIPENLFPNETDLETIAAEIKSIYLAENETFSDNLVQFARYYADNYFNRGVLKQAELASNYVPVYLYQFSYFGRPIRQPYIDGAEKATHGSEIPFLFNMTDYSQTTGEADLLTQNRIVTLWTNFAKYLNPTPEGSDLFDNILWPALNCSSNLYLNINDTLELKSSLKGDTVPQWDTIYETYGRKPFVTY